MQGLKTIIPADRKIQYINSLLQVGFDIIDVGSFVSPAAVPQMADTAQVIDGIKKEDSTSEIMVLVANEQGAKKAVTYDKISFLSFPFSVSPSFLKLNIRSSTDKAFYTALKINELAQKNKKNLFCYLTMGFGNPYGDKWNPEMNLIWIEKFRNEGIVNLSLSDITGEADPIRIKSVYDQIFREFPFIYAGIHLHTKPQDAPAKIEAAWYAGVRHFDTVLNGLGGCPMTGFELLENLNTFTLLDFAQKNNLEFSADITKLNQIAGFSLF